MANIDKIKVNGTTYNIIDTTSGYITSANDIYWCTYGTTTSEEIETAINAGKCPMVKYNDYTYTLRYRNSSTNHRFVCNYGGKEYSVVCQSSTWMPNGTLTFLTSAPVTSVNTKTGAVVLSASDVGALPSSTSIPTKTSDLTNDSGFLTSAVTTFNGQSGAITYSAPVSSVNGQTGAVSLSASDVDALPDSTVIPSKTSDLTNDSGFLTSAVTTFNGASGAVTYTAPVTSVNSQTGDVTISVPTVDQSYSSSSTNAQSGTAVASAINQVKCHVVTLSSFSSLPHTITDASITVDEVVVNFVLSNPYAQVGNWTITTWNGSLTIRGTISGSTTITLYLMKGV